MSLRFLSRYALMMLVLFHLSGCAVVLSPEPVGETPMPIVAAEWDGLWTAPEVGMLIRTVDAQRGLLDVMLIEGANTQTSRVHLKTANGWVFASFIDPEEDELPNAGPMTGIDASPAYLWMRVRKQNDTLTLWTPHVERFRNAVRAGDLPGEVGEESSDPVMLGTLTAAHYPLITETADGVLMDWEQPAVLVRVTARPGDWAPEVTATTDEEPPPEAEDAQNKD